MNEEKKHVLYMINKHKKAFKIDNDKRREQADAKTMLARGYLEHELCLNV